MGENEYLKLENQNFKQENENLFQQNQQLKQEKQDFQENMNQIIHNQKLKWKQKYIENMKISTNRFVKFKEEHKIEILNFKKIQEHSKNCFNQITNLQFQITNLNQSHGEKIKNLNQTHLENIKALN